MLGGWSATISNDTISEKSSSHKIHLKYSKLTLFSHNLVLHNRPLMTKIGACSSQFFGEEKNAAECRISQHLVLLLVPMNELLLHSCVLGNVHLQFLWKLFMECVKLCA